MSIFLLTGGIGGAFQKCTNYKSRVAVVLATPEAHGGRFGELAYEPGHAHPDPLRPIASGSRGLALGLSHPRQHRMVMGLSGGGFA